jgi:acyl-CoA thioesterase-2
LSQITSAWKDHPDYHVDISPLGKRARAMVGNVVLAQSDACLLVRETDHPEVIYFPFEALDKELIAPSSHHTVCPFKGQASYFDVVLPNHSNDRHVEENLIWAYQDPFEEVSELAGHVAFYADRARIEVEDVVSGDPEGRTWKHWPGWGDLADLLSLLDVTPVSPPSSDSTAHREPHKNCFVSAVRRDPWRSVVEGSQLLAQALVAAGKLAPTRRPTSASMVFSRTATSELPVQFDLEILHAGRSFETFTVLARQGERRCSPGLVLLQEPMEDFVSHAATPPKVASPSECRSLDLGVMGRDIRIVEQDYFDDPEGVAAPVLNAWVRYRESPSEWYLRASLLAHFTGHLSIATALRPHAGLQERQAHWSFSSANMALSIAFHGDPDTSQWMLYHHEASFAGGGLAHVNGSVFDQQGHLLASFFLEAMLRSLEGFRAAGLDQRSVL